jgi:hypothetical protein
MDGFTPLGQPAHIRLDQGLDTLDKSPAQIGSGELTYESSYEVQIDNRLASVVDPNGVITNPKQIDENSLATYELNIKENNSFVNEIGNSTVDPTMTIRGPRGTKLEFKLKSSYDLESSTALFTKLGRDQLGSAIGAPSWSASYTFKTIDTVIKVIGVDTGYQIDIPVKFAKVV